MNEHNTSDDESEKMEEDEEKEEDMELCGVVCLVNSVLKSLRSVHCSI